MRVRLFRFFRRVIRPPIVRTIERELLWNGVFTRLCVCAYLAIDCLRIFAVVIPVNRLPVSWLTGIVYVCIGAPVNGPPFTRRRVLLRFGCISLFG